MSPFHQFPFLELRADAFVPSSCHFCCSRCCWGILSTISNWNWFRTIFALHFFCLYLS